MHADHYDALGISGHADFATVREAYLRVMREHHPDLRPSDPRALERTRRANAAWEVLGNSARRASYDRLRSAHNPQARLAVTHVAYSPEHRRYRAEVHRVTVRAAALLMAVGTVVLAALG